MTHYADIRQANPQYISVNWEASGGGAFAVIPLEEKGRLPEHLPLFRGHTAVVLDTDWSPFDDSLIASGSDDAKAFIWKVPEGFKIRTEEGEESQDIAPVQRLSGHSRKIGHVLFNPAAANVLATSSGDSTIKVWDIEAAAPRLTIKHADIVQSLSWSANGSLMVTTSRDKKLRIWDVRQEKPAHVVPGHAGAKNSRVVWMGEHDRVVTTGFSRMSDRQLGLWDIRAPQEAIGGFQMLDSISGVCIPFWDDGTQCLYLAGKGDGNIRYFEYSQDKFEFLSEYKSADPQRGIAFLPKRGVNTHENEVMRAFKTVNDSYIEPISFIVPRRAEVFQDDIYPPAVGLRPAMSAKDWLDGATILPPKIDLASLYNGEGAVEVAAAPEKASFTASSQQPESASASETPIKPEPFPEPMPAVSASASVTARAPPPSMTEQTSTIKDLASKYTASDDDEEAAGDDDDDTSSFEEVPKPAERPSAAPKFTDVPAVTSKGPLSAIQDASIAPSAPSPPEPAKFNTTSSTPTNSPSPILHKVPTQNTAAAVANTSSPRTNAPTPTEKGDEGSSSSSESSMLKEIKNLLTEQTKAMGTQNERIKALTDEVEELKRAVGQGTR